MWPAKIYYFFLRFLNFYIPFSISLQTHPSKHQSRDHKFPLVRCVLLEMTCSLQIDIVCPCR